MGGQLASQAGRLSSSDGSRNHNRLSEWPRSSECNGEFTNGHVQLTPAMGSSRSLENYSRLSEQALPAMVHFASSAPSSIPEQPEFLFDRVDCNFNLFVETGNYHYKLLEPTVANLFAKRSKDPVWIAMFKLLRGQTTAEETFALLDAEGRFDA